MSNALPAAPTSHRTPSSSQAASTPLSTPDVRFCKSWQAVKDAIIAGKIRIGDVIYMQGLKFDIRDTNIKAETSGRARSQHSYVSDIPMGRTMERFEAAGGATQPESRNERPPTSISGGRTDTTSVQSPTPQQHPSSRTSSSVPVVPGQSAVPGTLRTYASAVVRAVAAPETSAAPAAGARGRGTAPSRPASRGRGGSPARGSDSARGIGAAPSRPASRGRGGSPARGSDSARGRGAASSRPASQGPRGSPARASPSRVNSAGPRAAPSTVSTSGRLHLQEAGSLDDANATPTGSMGSGSGSRTGKGTLVLDVGRRPKKPKLLSKAEKSVLGIERHHGIVLDIAADHMLFAATTTFGHAPSLVGNIAVDSFKVYCAVNKDPKDKGVLYEAIKMAAGDTTLLKWVYLRRASKIKFDDPNLEKISVEGPTGERYDEKTVEFIKECIRKNGPLDPDERKEGQEGTAGDGGEGSTPASGQQPVA